MQKLFCFLKSTIFFFLNFTVCVCKIYLHPHYVSSIDKLTCYVFNIIIYFPQFTFFMGIKAADFLMTIGCNIILISAADHKFPLLSLLIADKCSNGVNQAPFLWEEISLSKRFLYIYYYSVIWFKFRKVLRRQKNIPTLSCSPFTKQEQPQEKQMLSGFRINYLPTSE